MKHIKRITIAVLCVAFMFSGLPVAPFSFGTAITAAAAPDVSELQQLVNTIPDRQQWNIIYVDSSALAVAYDNATAILQSPGTYQQKDVTAATAQLKSVLNTIQYHTVGLAVDPREKTCAVGASVTLTVTKEPQNAVDSVTWVSNNTNAVEVNNSGKVTVKKYSAEPVLVSAVSNGTSSTCTLTITNPISKIRISKPNTPFFAGTEMNLSIEIIGVDNDADATDQITAVFWQSDNTAVATVSDSGTVKGVSAGTATITVSVTSAGKQFTAELALTVYHSEHNFVLSEQRDATCTENGQRIYICPECNSTYTEEVKAEGHRYGNWKVFQPEDPDEAGIEVRFCSVCGAYELRESQKTGSEQEEGNSSAKDKASGTVFQRLIQWIKNLFSKVFKR